MASLVDFRGIVTHMCPTPRGQAYLVATLAFTVLIAFLSIPCLIITMIAFGFEPDVLHSEEDSMQLFVAFCFHASLAIGAFCRKGTADRERLRTTIELYGAAASRRLSLVLASVIVSPSCAPLSVYCGSRTHRGICICKLYPDYMHTYVN